MADLRRRSRPASLGARGVRAGREHGRVLALVEGIAHVLVGMLQSQPAAADPAASVSVPSIWLLLCCGPWLSEKRAGSARGKVRDARERVSRPRADSPVCATGAWAPETSVPASVLETMLSLMFIWLDR